MRNPVLYTCKVPSCGAQFQHRRGEKSRYCATHRGLYYLGKPRHTLVTTQVCEICQTRFLIAARLIRYGRGTTCSHACRNVKLVRSRPQERARRHA